MSDTTWIKLYRKLTESLVFQNEKCLKIWIWCLCRAGYKDKEIILGRQRLQLKEGQFVMGGLKAEESLKIARTTIYYWLDFLAKEKMIDMKKTNKYTVITILNWSEHQGVDIKKTSDGHQMDIRWTQTRIDKKDKKDKKKDVPFSEQSSEVILSKLLFELMLKNNEKAKEPNYQTWAKNIDLMKRIDKRTDKEIEGAIRWSQQHHFWHKNILSTESLRKQFDKLYLDAKKEKEGNNGKRGATLEGLTAIANKHFGPGSGSTERNS